MVSKSDIHYLSIGSGRVESAFDIACEAYMGMTRKGTGEPYITHPVRVADILYRNGYCSAEALCGALLHDAIEDQHDQVARDYFTQAISLYCGDDTLGIVEGVTNPFYPDPNNRPSRKERQKEIRLKIAASPFLSGIVKIGDVDDNTSNVHQLGERFARQYLSEKIDLFDSMRERWGNTPFFNRVEACLEQRLRLVQKPKPNSSPHENDNNQPPGVS